MEIILVQVLAKAIDYIIDRYGVNVVLIPMHYPEDISISRDILNRVTKEGCYIYIQQI